MSPGASRLEENPTPSWEGYPQRLQTAPDRGPKGFRLDYTRLTHNVNSHLMGLFQER